MKTCQLCEATSAGTAVRFRRRWPICTWCEEELARRGVRYCAGCAQTYAAALAIASSPLHCPACRTARRRAKYQANVDYERASSRARRNISAEADARRLRYQTDPEYRARKQAYHRAYYWRNRDKWRTLRSTPQRLAKMNELRRRWRAAHREHEAARKRLGRIRQKLAILRGLS